MFKDIIYYVFNFKMVINVTNL